MKINRYSLKGVSYLSNDFDEYEMCLDNDGDYVKFDDCDILEDSDRQKLEMFDEMLEAIKLSDTCLKHARQYIKNIDKGFSDTGMYSKTNNQLDNILERAKKLQEAVK